MNEIEELIKTYKKDIDNLTKSMGLSSPLNETRKRELLTCLEFGITTLQRISTDPVEVPEFIKNVMQKYNSLQDMLTEEYYSNDTSENDNDAVFCWIDTNFDLLCRAWLDGSTVAKEPLYIMPVPCTHNGTLHYCLKDDGEISFRQGNAYKFTKDQIEKYFAEIKELAVSVEEESE